MSDAMISLSTRRSVRHQSGFTIVEMMVALSISMVVVLGFAVSFVNMKSTFNSQNSLLQLQDNERLAMTVLTASVGEAGFFPNGSNLNASPAVPIQYTDRSSIILGSSMPAGTPGGTMSAGQYIFGTAGDATTVPVTPETLSTAYASAPGDGLLSCQGGSNTSATAIATVRNTFYVDPATNTLMCAVVGVNATGSGVAPTSAAQPLISNVSAMSVVYGLDTDGDGNLDHYKAMKDMAAATLADWNKVKNVQVTLTFINPNYPNDSTKAISWTQTINVMNNK